MAKMTNRNKIIAGLTALGFVQDTNARTSKYLVFKEPGKSNAYLVGKSGALRKTNSTVAKSISLTDAKVCKVIMTVGERANEYKTVEQAREDFGVLLSG